MELKIKFAWQKPFMIGNAPHVYYKFVKFYNLFLDRASAAILAIHLMCTTEYEKS